MQRWAARAHSALLRGLAFRERGEGVCDFMRCSLTLVWFGEPEDSVTLARVGNRGLTFKPIGVAWV